MLLKCELQLMLVLSRGLNYIGASVSYVSISERQRKQTIAKAIACVSELLLYDGTNLRWLPPMAPSDVTL